jgi:glutathione S-transferase
MNITLAFAPGTCARVPLIALEEAGVPYETRLVRFMKGEHKSPDYLALNPAGKVPALIIDGKPLAQNVAILTYLARRFPEAGLLPLTGNAYEDAALISRLAWCSADLHQLVTRMRLPAFSCDLPDTAERIRNMAAAAMAAQLAGIEADLARQPWLLGDDWSVLDAYIYWIWWRITGAGFPQARFPTSPRTPPAWKRARLFNARWP